MKIGIDACKRFIPWSSCFNVTWSKTRFGSSPGYIKMLIVTKFTLCLPYLTVSKKRHWTSGGSTVVHKTQHTDSINIRYLSYERPQCNWLVEVRRSSLSISFKGGGGGGGGLLIYIVNRWNKFIINFSASILGLHFLYKIDAIFLAKYSGHWSLILSVVFFSFKG